MCPPPPPSNDSSGSGGPLPSPQPPSTPAGRAAGAAAAHLTGTQSASALLAFLDGHLRASGRSFRLRALEEYPEWAPADDGAAAGGAAGGGGGGGAGGTAAGSLLPPLTPGSAAAAVAAANAGPSPNAPSPAAAMVAAGVPEALIQLLRGARRGSNGELESLIVSVLGTMIAAAADPRPRDNTTQQEPSISGDASTNPGASADSSAAANPAPQLPPQQPQRSHSGLLLGGGGGGAAVDGAGADGVALALADCGGMEVLMEGVGVPPMGAAAAAQAAVQAAFRRQLAAVEARKGAMSDFLVPPIPP